MKARWGGNSTGLVAGIQGFAPVLLFFVVWELVGIQWRNPLLPPPSAWFRALGVLGAERIGQALVTTIVTFTLGVLLATAVGACLGIVIGYSSRLERFLGPLLEFMRALPAPVIVPIAVLAWGTGLVTSLFSVAFAASWPVLLNTIQAVKARPRLHGDVARTLQLGKAREVLTMIIPGAVPGILNGYRVAVPLALIIAVLVEMLTASGGIGNLLLIAQRRYNSAETFGLLFVAGCLGYLVALVTLLLTRRLLSRLPPEQR